MGRLKGSKNKTKTINEEKDLFITDIIIEPKKRGRPKGSLNKKKKLLKKKNSNNENWQQEWQGMPEFVQEDLSPFKSVIVHFRNEEDFDTFEKLMEQEIIKQNQKISIWYPKMEKRRYADKRYIDES